MCRGFSDKLACASHLAVPAEVPRIRVTARGLKTINKNGAYRALKKAGAIAG
jgi:ribosomal protein L28